MDRQSMSEVKLFMCITIYGTKLQPKFYKIVKIILNKKALIKNESFEYLCGKKLKFRNIFPF